MTRQAATLYRSVEAYLAGAMNEAALEHWRLAVAKSLERGVALDTAIGQMAQLYVKKFGVPTGA